MENKIEGKLENGENLIKIGFSTDFEWVIGITVVGQV